MLTSYFYVLFVIYFGLLCIVLFKILKRKFSEQLTSENSTKKVRQYSADYLDFGFVRDVTDETKPYCLKSKQKSLDTMFKTQISMNERGLQASYELSFLLARKSRPHTDGEELLKPAFEIYLRTIQDNKGAVGNLPHYPSAMINF